MSLQLLGHHCAEELNRDTADSRIHTHASDSVCSDNQSLQEQVPAWVCLNHLALKQLVEKVLSATHHLLLYAFTQHSAFLTCCAGCHLLCAEQPVEQLHMHGVRVQYLNEMWLRNRPAIWEKRT